MTKALLVSRFFSTFPSRAGDSCPRAEAVKEVVICVLVLLALAVYTLLACGVMAGLRATKVGAAAVQPSVTVVCAARNEAHNLAGLLSCLLAQSYPSSLLEFVLVDDRSEDGTGALLQRWAREDARVRVVHVDSVPPGVGPKKNALAQGIAQAHGELLFLTDADCRPPVGWVEGMVRYFDQDVGLVAGYAPLEGKGLVGAVVALDTLAAAAVAAAGMALGRPITCTGRNLAYRRRVYDQVGGLEEILHSTSGDDDLFLHLVARRTGWQPRYALCPSTFVRSAGPTTVRHLLRQRRRHLSAGWRYPARIKAGYAAFHLSNVALWAAPIWALVAGGSFIMCGLALALKLVLDAWVLGLAARRFGQQLAWGAFCLWELYFVLNNTVLGLASRVGQIRWRD